MSEHSPGAGDAGPADAREATTVRHIMRPTTTIEPEAHLAAALYRMRHSHDVALVVMTSDTQEPMATITAAEIGRAIGDGRDPEQTRVRQVVTARRASVEANVVADDAARLLLSRGVDRLPVVDGGQLIGIVELADLQRTNWESEPLAAV